MRTRSPPPIRAPPLPILNTTCCRWLDELLYPFLMGTSFGRRLLNREHPTPNDLETIPSLPSRRDPLAGFSNPRQLLQTAEGVFECREAFQYRPGLRFRSS